MINKDGKLFGKISIVDIAVILIIVILAVGIYVRFGSNAVSEVVSGEKIECTFIVKNVRSYTAEALKKGGPLYDKTSKEYIGEITNVEITDGKYQVNMADGTFKAAVPDERYNVYVTVEFTGKTSDTGHYTAANKYLAAGTSVILNTKYAQCESDVYSINVKE